MIESGAARGVEPGSASVGIRVVARRLLGEKGLGFVDYLRHPEERDSWGGPFNGQRGRQQLFLDLHATCRFERVIETGAYRGTTTEFLNRVTKAPVLTVESNPRSVGYCRARFLWNPKVSVRWGDSRALLRSLTRHTGTMAKRTFFYLDAHWSEDLPLREELMIVFENWGGAVAMVDDFQVVGDEGYGYDDFGPGHALTLQYLEPLPFALFRFFPSLRSGEETGMRRGCVILVRDIVLTEQIRAVAGLRQGR